MIEVRTVEASCSVVTGGTFFSLAYAGERRALIAPLPVTIRQLTVLSSVIPKQVRRRAEAHGALASIMPGRGPTFALRWPSSQAGPVQVRSLCASPDSR